MTKINFDNPPCIDCNLANNYSYFTRSQHERYSGLNASNDSSSIDQLSPGNEIYLHYKKSFSDPLHVNSKIVTRSLQHQNIIFKAPKFVLGNSQIAKFQ